MYGAFSEVRHLSVAPAGRLLIGVCAGIALVTVAGLILLWPHGGGHGGPTDALGGKTVAADVQVVRTTRCPGPIGQACRQIVVRVNGRDEPITLGPLTASPSVHIGESVRVSRVQIPPGGHPIGGQQNYTFVDVDRHHGLWLIGIVLIAFALIVLRLRGFFAALGVGLSLFLMTTFLVPAILDGRPALLVALVSALAVMFVTLVLTNGIGAQTLAATVGITATLALACGLASGGIALAHLDGQSNELSLFLGQQNHKLSLRGVVLAGMIVGALGVLADTAVTQASAVMALRRADPTLTARKLYRGAFVVGRDHLSATIHTLVLAYAGVALPLLLVLRSSHVAVADAVNAQDVAEPIVATAVGCFALIAAVPLTTGLASLLVSRLPAELVPEAHGHHH